MAAYERALECSAKIVEKTEQNESEMSQDLFLPWHTFHHKTVKLVCLS